MSVYLLLVFKFRAAPRAYKLYYCSNVWALVCMLCSKRFQAKSCSAQEKLAAWRTHGCAKCRHCANGCSPSCWKGRGMSKAGVCNCTTRVMPRSMHVARSPAYVNVLWADRLLATKHVDVLGICSFARLLAWFCLPCLSISCVHCLNSC